MKTHSALKSVLLLIMLTIGSLATKASHIPGANISYKCIGPNRYEITMTTIVRCPSSNPTGQYLYITNDCGIPVTGVTFVSGFTTTYKYTNYAYGYMQNDPTQHNVDVSQICSRQIANNRCNGGTLPGVRMTVYKGVIELPACCNSWRFKWSSCCRDITTNLTGTPGIWVETTMNSCDFPCDNSPVINTTPIPYACAGQNICYNLNVVDPDGDSLVYALAPAYSGSGTPPTGTPVPYGAGYNSGAPIPGVTINAQNGQICFNTTAGNYVFNVLITSYDKATGKVKGTFMYDFQVIVINCTNTTPQPPSGGVTNMTGTGTIVGPADVEICEGGNMCFDLVFTDPDNGDTLNGTSNAATVLPGATVTYSGVNPLTVRICWTAPVGGPYGTQSFTITVDDGACPILAQTSSAINVKVKPVPTLTMTNDTICAGQSATVGATGSPGGGTYSWTPGGQTTSTINVSPGATTSYNVSYDLNGCGATGTATVVVNPQPTVTTTGTTICAGQTANISANVNPGGGTYSWAPGGMTTQTINVSPGSSTTYTVTYTAPGGCTSTDTAIVTVNPQPTVAVNNTTICAGQSATLAATPSVGGGGYSWAPGGQTTQSITVSPGATTTYTVTYNLNGCTATASGTVTVNPQPTITVTNDTICSGQSGSITATPSVGGGAFSWAPGGYTSGTITPSPGSTTTYTVTYTLNGCTATGSGTITVNPQPTVNVSGSTTICAGQSATLSGAGNPGGGTYSWAPGGQTTSSITVSPGATTTYTLTYDLNGCTATATGTVTVNPQPTVTLPNAQICLGQSTTLSPTVNAGAWSYSWSPGGQTTQNITVSPATTTSYTVIVTGAGGCADTATATVTVTANPTVNIPNDTICAGQSGSLTAQPSVPGGTYSWTPGGETTQTITKTPGSTTSYSVTYNMAGCVGNGTGTIVVNPQPTVAATNATICAGQNGTITATPSIGGGTYSWSPGGMTTQSITVSPGATTTYTVTYDLNGCAATATGTVTVNPQPTITANDPSICAGQVAAVTSAPNPTGGTYSWAPGGQTTQNINVSPGTTTNYVVTYTLNGCVATDTSTVSVISNPTAAFTAPNVCDGYAMQFTDNSVPSPAGSYAWDFGDGSGTSTQQNPSYTYPGPGTYTVKLKITAGSGCADSVTQTVTIDPLPQPAFNATPACPTFGTAFTNNSTIAAPGTITGWSWDFGDGNTSNQQNPTNAYGSGGTYTVKLIATSAAGCVDSVTQTVTIPYKPVANMTWDTVCFGDPTTFGDLSTVTNGTITGWNWDFGDGNTSTNQNPTNSYGAAGTYTVTLIVTSNDGCTDTITGSVPVSATPVANFTATTACDGFATQFTDASTISAGAISSWTWDFGDGSGTSTQQNPSYTYPGPGSYNVKLVVAAGSGCSDSITIPVTVNPLPTPAFTQTDVCANSAMNFTDNSTIPAPGTITGWNWDYGDGSPNGTAQNPSHTYTTPGQYTVKLIVTSGAGCVDSITQTVNVFALPNTDFTMDTVCLGDQTCFQDLSTVQNSNVTGWQWVFGDGSPTNNNSNPCHTYANPGSYNVTLIVTTAQGCTGTKNGVAIVNDNPTADFTVSNVCQSDAAQFADNSTIGSGTITGWKWDFGNGNTSTQQNPSHQYQNSGTYTVQLVAFAGTGCSDTATGPVVIHPMPTADFNFNNVCDGTTMPFTDASSVGAGTLAGWNWDFGDGNTSTNQNPTNPYSGPGNYNVQLIVTTDSGCTDTIMKGVEVYPMPNVDFTPNSVCEGQNTQFSDQSNVPGGSVQSWIWNFGDGTPNQSGQNPLHTYPVAGTYNAMLTVTTNNGCTDSVTKPVNVNPLPVVDFVADTLEGCAPVCPNFTNQVTISSGNIATYSWDFGDGSSSTSPDPTHCFTNTTLTQKTFDITLTAVSDSGCVTTATKNGYIRSNPYPIADFYTDPEEAKVSDPEIGFFDESSGAAQWRWDFGDGDTSTVQTPVHTYPDSGTYTIRLIIANQYGCEDTAYNQVRIEPEFFIYIPNAFTPGADGINDLWYPVVYGADQMDTYIFDRWGELIWEGHQLDSKWDGMVKGTKAETEVFVYLIQVKTVEGQQKEFRGKVTLLK